jgi:hypothetical protein
MGVIIKLQGDPDHVVALLGKQSGRDRTVDAARHGDDYSGIGSGPAKLEINGHGDASATRLYSKFTLSG